MNYAPAGSRYDQMVYRECGRSGLKLPALSLGLWHNFGDDVPLTSGRHQVPIEDEATVAIVLPSQIGVLDRRELRGQRVEAALIISPPHHAKL